MGNQNLVFRFCDFESKLQDLNRLQQHKTMRQSQIDWFQTQINELRRLENETAEEISSERKQMLEQRIENAETRRANAHKHLKEIEDLLESQPTRESLENEATIVKKAMGRTQMEIKNVQ